MTKHELVDVKPLEDYMLLLVYKSGERRVFNVKPYITGSWFGELKNPDVFRSVCVKNNTAEWSGGQDIAPHELYELSVEAAESPRDNF